MLELQEEILRLRVQTREIERTLAEYPNDRSLLLTLKSAEQEICALNEELEAETEKMKKS